MHIIKDFYKKYNIKYDYFLYEFDYYIYISHKLNLL